jgi:Flp pilus assembly pilin Flp
MRTAWRAGLTTIEYALLLAMLVVFGIGLWTALFPPQ